MIRLDRSTAFLILMLNATSTFGGTDWHQWHGPKRDGVSPEFSGWDGTNWRISEVWRSGQGGVVNRGFAVSPPLVVRRAGDAAARVYAMGRRSGRDTIYCLGADTGRTLWTESYAGPDYGRHNAPQGNKAYYRGPMASPIMDVQTSYLYTLSCDGDLRCWDTSAQTDRAVWRVDLHARYGGVPQSRKEDYGFVASPLLHAGRLIIEVGDNSGNVIAFDKTTGREAWRSANTDGRGIGSPIAMTLDGVPCIAAVTRRHAVVMRTDAGHEGETVAEYPWDARYSGNIPSPLVLGNRLLVSQSDGSGCRAAALDIGLNGYRKVFEQKRWWWGPSTAAIHEEHLYFVHSRKIRCHAADGREVWSSDNTLKDAAYNKFDSASILVCGGDAKLIIWCGRDTGELRLAEAAPSAGRYRQLATATNVIRRHDDSPKHYPGYNHVVLGHGRLVCNNVDGDLVCFAVDGKGTRAALERDAGAAAPGSVSPRR